MHKIYYASIYSSLLFTSKRRPLYLLFASLMANKFCVSSRRNDHLDNVQHIDPDTSCTLQCLSSNRIPAFPTYVIPP